MNYYLLDNDTQRRIETIKQNPSLIKLPKEHNQTKPKLSLSQNKLSAPNRSSRAYRGGSRGEIDDSGIGAQTKAKGRCELFRDPFENNRTKHWVGRSYRDLVEEQKSDNTLRWIYDSVESKKGPFQVKNGVLFRSGFDFCHQRRNQLVIPMSFRQEVLKVSDLQAPRHLKSKRMKESILRHYF